MSGPIANPSGVKPLTDSSESNVAHRLLLELDVYAEELLGDAGMVRVSRFLPLELAPKSGNVPGGGRQNFACSAYHPAGWQRQTEDGTVAYHHQITSGAKSN